MHQIWKLSKINHFILNLQAKECSSILAVQVQWFYAFSTSIQLVSLKTQNMKVVELFLRVPWQFESSKLDLV